MNLHEAMAPYVSIELLPIGPGRFSALYRCSDVEYGAVLACEEGVTLGDLACHLRDLHRCPVTARQPRPDSEGGGESVTTYPWPKKDDK